MLLVAACRAPMGGELRDRDFDDVVGMLGSEDPDVRDAAEEELLDRAHHLLDGGGVRFELAQWLGRTQDPEIAGRLTRILGAAGVVLAGPGAREGLKSLWDILVRLSELIDVIHRRTSEAWRRTVDAEVANLIGLVEREFGRSRAEAARRMLGDLGDALRELRERNALLVPFGGGTDMWVDPEEVLDRLGKLIARIRKILRGHNDLDRDGMGTDWELEHGFDPTRDDSMEDPDRDGRSNLEEFDLGSNPRRFTPRTD